MWYAIHTIGITGIYFLENAQQDRTSLNGFRYLTKLNDEFMQIVIPNKLEEFELQ